MREAGDRSGEGNALNMLGWSCLQVGDYALAGTYFDQELRPRREIGSRRHEASALNSCGELCDLLGDYRRALGFHEEAVRLYRGMGSTFNVMYPLSDLSNVARCPGDYARAQEYAEEALGVACTTDRDPEGGAHQALGRLYQDLGEPVAALGYYRQALEIARSLGARRIESSLAGSLAGLAWAVVAQGKLLQAQRHATEALAYLEDGGALRPYSRPFWIYLTCYRVFVAAGDRRAAEVLNTAYRLLQEHAARAPDEVMRKSFLENVAENREIVAEFGRVRT